MVKSSDSANETTGATATLVQIAKLYYLEQRSQQEIADELGVSRSLVALYLKRAKEQGIVRFSIVDPQDSCEDLSATLREVTGIQHVTVVPSAHNSSLLTRRSLAGAVARYLEATLKDGDVVGIGWGRTINEMTELLAPSTPRKIEVVPVLGESASSLSGEYSQINQTVMQFAHAFNGQPHFLLAPLIVGSKELRDKLYEDETVQRAASFWDHLDYSIMGIGSIPPQNGQIVYIGPEKLSDFEKRGAIGDVLVRYFDAQGRYIHTSLYDRLIGIDLEQLSQAKHRIALASGIGKAKATVGILRSQICNELFVDEELARAALAELKSL